MTETDLTTIESFLLSSPRFLEALGRPVPKPGTWEASSGNWSWRDGVAEGTGYPTRAKAEVALAHWRRAERLPSDVPDISRLRAAFPERIWSGVSVLAEGICLYQGDAVRVELYDGVWSASVRRVSCGDHGSMLLAALAGDNFQRGTVLS